MNQVKQLSEMSDVEFDSFVFRKSSRILFGMTAVIVTVGLIVEALI